MTKHLWKKGESGNPKGRPKEGFSFAALIKAEGDRKDQESNKKKKRRIIEIAYEQALKGDARAREWLADRAEGRSPEFVYTGEIDSEVREIGFNHKKNGKPEKVESRSGKNSE